MLKRLLRDQEGAQALSVTDSGEPQGAVGVEQHYKYHFRVEKPRIRKKGKFAWLHTPSTV